MGVGADFRLRGVTVLGENAFTFFVKICVCVCTCVRMSACLRAWVYVHMCLWVNTQKRVLDDFELQGAGVCGMPGVAWVLGPKL